MPERLLSAYGHRFAVEAPVEVLEHIADALPPTYQDGDGTPERTWTVTRAEERWRVACDGEVSLPGASFDGALRALLSELELWVGEAAQERIFVHAGCVVHAGRAILLPGRSMAGKTTLTLALVAAGAQYFSDEYAVLDATGRVHPYRRPPAVRPSSPYAGRSPLPATSQAIAGLATVAAGPVPVGLCARLRYRADLGWEIEEVSPAAGILELMDNTLAARSRTVEALATFAALSRSARFVSGFRSDADVAAYHLLDVLHSTTAL